MSVKQFFEIFRQAVRGEEADYTKGGIKTALVLLAIPMILEMLMESLFAIVDVFLVAKISNNAVATVGMTEGVLMLVESVAIGIAMATTAMVARRIGEKKITEASDVAMQAIFLGFLVAAITGVLAFIYAEDILRLLGAEEDLIKEGSSYTRIILSFNIILMMLFILNGIFRAAGNAAIAMRTLILSNAINIILDPILIFGLGPITGMGIEGAAIATCIGRGTGVMYQIYVLLSGGSLIKIYNKFLRLNVEIIGKLIRVSAGGAGQFLISTASWIFLISILASFGSVTVAGYTIAIRIIIFSILPAWGLANATATLVGQNLGANQAERAERTVWMAGKYNMIFLLILSIVFILFGKVIVSFFTEDPLVVQEGILCLKIISLGYVFFAYEMIIAQAFNGAGDTITPTVLNFIFMWLIQIPLAYYLSYYLIGDSRGVYLSIAISSSLMASCAIFLFKKGRWKKTKI